MKDYIHICFLMIITMFFSGCISENVINDHCLNPGKPATIHLKLVSPEMKESSRGLLESQEKKIDRLYVLVFYPDGELVSKTKFEDINDEMTVEAYTTSGDNMNIYVLANYSTSADDDDNKVMESELDAVTSLEDYKSVCFRFIPEQMATPIRLPMTGELTRAIQAGDNNNITLNLNYLHAKVTFKVVDATTHRDCQFGGWRLCDARRKTGIIDPKANIPQDLYSLNDFVSFENSSNTESNQVDLYILENYAGERLSYNNLSNDNKSFYNTLTGYKKEQVDNGYYGKSLFAPNGATYMECNVNINNRNLKGDKQIPIYNQISKNGKYYNARIKMYIGSNDIDNYDVKRGTHYTCTLTIKDGLDMEMSTTMDSNISADTHEIMVSTSSCMTLDAHPDSRDICIKADKDVVKDLSVEILDNARKSYNDGGFSATWLKLSTFSMTRSQIKQSGVAGLWQEDVAVGHYAHPKFIPHHDRRYWLEHGTGIGSPGDSYISPKSYSVPNGISLKDDTDYPYNDDELDYNIATHRMCYKIKNLIPPDNSNDAVETFDISVNADEYEYDEKKSETRGAIIKISYKVNNCTKQLFIPIIQRQPLFVALVPYTFNNTDQHSVKLLIEDIEENTLILHPELPISHQKTNIMQWGFPNEKILSNEALLKGGNYQTVSEVIKNDIYVNSTLNSLKWSKKPYYRDLYRSGVIKKSDKINQPSDYLTTGAPYYYPNINNSSDDDYFDPVYNTTAARYCFEKNKDIDGNGEIDDWEYKWFLPSSEQLQQIWVAQYAITTANVNYGTGFYLSSTELNAANVYNIGFTTGFMNAYEKASLDLIKKNGAVRAVRRLNDSKHIISSHVLDVKNGIPYLDFSNFPSNSVSIISKGSGVGILSDERVSESSKTVFKRLRIAKKDYEVNGKKTFKWNEAAGFKEWANSQYAEGKERDGSLGANQYYENADGSDKGKWRLPTKRELVYLIIADKKISNLSGYTNMNSSSKIYWCASERNVGTSYYGHCASTSGIMSNNTKVTPCYARFVMEDNSTILYRLSYNPNGGYSAPASKMIYGNATVTIPNIVPKHPDGKVFNYWEYGTNKYYVGNTFNMPAHNVVLKAIWK